MYALESRAILAAIDEYLLRGGLSERDMRRCVEWFAQSPQFRSHQQVARLMGGAPSEVDALVMVLVRLRLLLCPGVIETEVLLLKLRSIARLCGAISGNLGTELDFHRLRVEFMAARRVYSEPEIDQVTYPLSETLSIVRPGRELGTSDWLKVVVACVDTRYRLEGLWHALLG